MTDEQRKRIHKIVYSCDDRAELAERIVALEDDNAKLRELVRTMMRFFEDDDWCITCWCAKECDAQEQYEDDCLMRDVFRDLMRELGIEGEDD